jgi:hypothetical protein
LAIVDRCSLFTQPITYPVPTWIKAMIDGESRTELAIPQAITQNTRLDAGRTATDRA